MRDELRIGNLVRTSIYYDTDEAKEDLGEDYSEDKEWIIDTVQGICHPDEEFMYWGESEVEDGTNRTEGIPLTEKWHNYFGVEYNNALSEFVYELPEKYNFKLIVVFGGDYVWLRQKGKTPMDDDIITLWNKDLTKRDMYVHEWQNLYYALSANELKREEKRKEKASTP